jgi:arabinose-5-phosphate isomerase
MTSKRLGITAVTDENEQLLGLITDGDLRRLLESGKSLDEVRARDIMTSNPKTIEPDTLAVGALELLRKYGISQLAVTEGGLYRGIIHLHDLIREGLI